MNKRIRTACLLCASTFLMLNASFAQTAEAIIDNYLKVSGGKAAYSKISQVSVKLQGTMLGNNIFVSNNIAFPNKRTTYMLMNGNEVSREEFDGQNGFVINNGMKRAMTPFEIGKAKYENLFLPELYYKDHDIVVSYQGIHTLKKYTGQYHKVMFQTPAGTTSYFYYDTSSGLLARTAQSDGSYVHYLDFRNYEGFLLPYQFVMKNGIMKLNLQVTEVQLAYNNTYITQVPQEENTYQSTTTPSIAKPAARSQYHKKLALIMGNSTYRHGGALRNPVNDARAMSSKLKGLGFEVIYYENITQSDMKRAIDNFGERLRGYDVGLFYYAGHGIQYKGQNYIIPIEANLKSERQVEYDCIAADRVLAFMEHAQSDVNIIILDACRNNPFERSWRRTVDGAGLAFMNAPVGSMIAYATSPGTTASDGTGQNGLYTAALLKHMGTQGMTIEQMFKRVRVDVEKNSKGKQVPWESTSLKGEFYFSPQ